jgi:predicted DNA-binding protein with PD1-like motif
MQHHHFGDGRHVLRLDAGEELVATLRAFCQEQEITAGLVTGLGSVDQVILGFLDPELREYVRRRFEERMEVGSLTGSISMEGDKPFVHIHAVLAPREQLAYTGHIHEAKVGATLELFLTAFPGTLSRVQLPTQPFPSLFLPGETRPEGDAAGK